MKKDAATIAANAAVPTATLAPRDRIEDLRSEYHIRPYVSETLRRELEAGSAARSGSTACRACSTRPTPASTRSNRSASSSSVPARTSSPPWRSRDGTAVRSPRARRRDVAGGSGGRPGPPARYLQVFQPHHRSERRGALGVGRARRGARRAERGAAAARAALRPGHFDGEPRDARRHDRQQFQRRAIGAVRENDRPRARARRRARRRERGPLSSALPGRARRGVRRRGPRLRLPPDRARTGEGVRGGNRSPVSEGPPARRRLQLDEFVDPSKPFNLAKVIVGSEGTLGLVVAAKVRLVPLPAAKAVLTIEFGHLLDALGATPLILRHHPSAVEVMDRFILDHARENDSLNALRRRVLQTDSPGALLCVEMYADRPGDLPPRFDALERELAAAGIACTCGSRADGRGSGAHLEPARGRAGAVDGDEGRRQIALLRGRHRPSRPRSCATTSIAFSRS